jgi:hypothetical protein
MDDAPELSDPRSPAGAIALVCAALGAPFCLRLALYYVADPGSVKFFRLVTQADHGWARGTLDFGSSTGLALAVVGVVLGGVVIVTGGDRGAPPRPARVALYLGLADIAVVAAAALAMYLLDAVHWAL